MISRPPRIHFLGGFNFFALFSGQTVISCPVAIERVLLGTRFSLMLSAKVGIFVQIGH